MNRDIETRGDLHMILREFYSLLLSDEKLYPFFEKFTDEETLEIHLKHLVDFWDSALFYRGVYKKNVMAIHKRIDEELKMETEHFEAWLSHFEQAVNKYHIGENSETLKARARSIATVMQIKFRNPDE